MAAEVFEALSYKGPSVSSPSFPGQIVRSFKVDLDLLLGNTTGVAGPGTAIEANDVIRFFKLPPYAKMLWAKIDSEALDGHATPTLTASALVSNGTTTKNFFVNSTIVQGGGIASTLDGGSSGAQDAFDSDSAVGFVTDDDNYYVDLKFTAAAATGQNDGIGLTIAYTMLLEPGELPAR